MINTAFTPNLTRGSRVEYQVTLSATNPLLAGSSTATATLQYSTNGGTTWVTISQRSIGSSVAVGVVVAYTNTITVDLSGYIPAGAQARITSTVVGTGSVTLIEGYEY